MRILIALYAGLCFSADLSLEGPAILARRCAGCHGARNQTASVDLSKRETAMPKLEAILRRVRLGQMPPNGALPLAEQELLGRWIAAGAPWKAKEEGIWWSLRPLRPVSATLDQIVAAKLRENGLAASQPADRRTLIRRVTYGLTGLPPAPEEVEAFVKDNRADAYEKLVDRLLASPHYGERWARHWLDVARFTESEGFERDLMREHAWPYRDYVIRSFNEDKPYLQFAREQIAGDLLEAGAREGVIATGFLVSGPTDAVGLTSAVEREREAVREDQLEEMVGAVSQTFLGLTTNCARCHDHKFDPIPQRDYYRFKAALAGVWQPFHDPASTELFPDGRLLDERQQAAAKALKNRMAALEQRIADAHGVSRHPLDPQPIARWNFDVDARDQIGGLHASLGSKAQNVDGRLKSTGEVTVLTAPLTRDVTEKTLEIWFYAHSKPAKGGNLMEIANRRGYRGAAIDGIRLTGGPKRQWVNVSTASFRTAEVHGPEEVIEPGKRMHVAITYAADGTIRIYRNGAPYGEAYRPEAGTSGKLQTYLAGDAVVRFTSTPDLELDEARLYTLALSEQQVANSYRQGAPSRLPGEALAQGPMRELRALVEQMEKLPKPEKSFAAQPREPGVSHVLRRGDVTQKGDVVTPGGLSTLPGADFGLPAAAPERERRLALASWIANENNPLFSRVMVNRLWSHHFGTGIVENPNDFGANGGAPSHEELLDRLASDFIRSGWSLKKLHKAIVMSAAYRQASAYRPEAAAKDAGNRWLWRYSPRRLEGEAVRDAMLTVSGKLNRQMGGPSFRPFTVTKPGGSYQKYEPRDSDEPELQRRSVYRMNINTGGDPMLESLDCPVPSVKTPKRPSTTTPLQALSLMNNPFSVRLSKAFAARVRGEAANVEAQVTRAFLLALGRTPSGAELEAGGALVRDQNLEALCWGLFNASEFIQIP